MPLDVDGTFYDSIGFHGDGEEKGEGDDSVYFLPNEMHDETVCLLSNRKETVCLLSNRKSKPDSYVDLSINMEDYHRIKNEEK